jgi:hypothetical protein
MPTYSCPKCLGDEFFLRNETKLVAGPTGPTGITSMKNVPAKTPTCKKCNETMDVLPTPEELAQELEYKERVNHGLKSLLGLVFSFLGVVILANLLFTLFS